MDKNNRITLVKAIKQARSVWEPDSDTLGRIKQRILTLVSKPPYDRVLIRMVKPSRWVYGLVGLAVVLGLMFIIYQPRPSDWTNLTQRLLKGRSGLSYPTYTSVAYAAEKVQDQINYLSQPNILIHTITRLILYNPQGQVDQQITYDLWQDNASARFKNVVWYPNNQVIQIHNGFTRWDYDAKDKTLVIEHYVNTPQNGLPRVGSQVRLLSEFQQVLDHQADLKIDQGKYNNQPVLVLSFKDDQVGGDNNEPESLYYEYYFNADFELVGKRIWRLIDGNKVLAEEMVVDKYEAVKRDKANLDEIFRFNQPRIDDLKVTEIYRDATTLSIITPTPAFNQVEPSPQTNNGQNPPTITSWQIYTNDHYQVRFKYPDSYTLIQSSDCDDVTFNPDICLLALTIDPNLGEFMPKAHFYLVKGINQVSISGQLSTIEFDSDKGVWIKNSPDSRPAVILPVWGQTTSGQDIIKASNGGSQASYEFYLIPNYQQDRVAVFTVPLGFRLRCDEIIYPDDPVTRANCRKFMAQIMDRYDVEDDGSDIIWLPKEFIREVYGRVEDMVKSYQGFLSNTSLPPRTGDKILGARIIEDCRLQITTSRRTVFVPTGYDQVITSLYILTSDLDPAQVISWS